MINIDFRPYNPSKKIEKNNLYKLTESGVVLRPEVILKKNCWEL